MYHFVKFNNTWYLKPEKLEDVIEHFKKFCGREFKQGFDDFKDNTIIKKDYNGDKYLYSKNHSSSHWRNVVELTMQLTGESWLKSACSLEERTFKDRIKKFTEGKPIFFTDGLSYFPPKECPEYDEELWKEELEFPYEYNFEDVKFIQWKGGRHWYAKLGSIDIVSEYGEQKWNDKYYAMEVAKKWCKCSGDWSKYKK